MCIPLCLQCYWFPEITKSFTVSGEFAWLQSFVCVLPCSHSLISLSLSLSFCSEFLLLKPEISFSVPARLLSSLQASLQNDRAWITGCKVCHLSRRPSIPAHVWLVTPPPFSPRGWIYCFLLADECLRIQALNVKYRPFGELGVGVSLYMKRDGRGVDIEGS